MKLAYALICLPTLTMAEVKGDLDAFSSCVLDIMQDNQENFMAPVMAPIMCGERHVPLRQACAWPEYLILADRIACQSQDYAFWKNELERLEALAEAEGRGGRGELFASGKQRCDAEQADDDTRFICETELMWRTAMEFLSAQAQVDAATAVEGSSN